MARGDPDRHEEPTMARYIQLINYTEEGIERIEDVPELNDQASALAEELGGEIVDFYMTLGQYDAAVIVEVPDAKTVAVGTITMAKTGAIETETLRAFDEAETEEILEAVAA